MNREEQLAKGYLELLEPDSLVFEPDGNITPDFLLNGDVAVEVTRLNEHIEVQGKLKRLDDDSPGIIAFLKNIIKSHNSKFSDANFYVVISIKQPFGDRKKVKKKLINLLDSFESKEDVIIQKDYKISDSLSISFLRGSLKSSVPTFSLGIISEHDSGGWVFENVSKNLLHCVNTKSIKVEPHLSKYREWWLVLIDMVAFGDYDDMLDELKASVDKNKFNKIIVLGGLDGQFVFEI